MRAFPLAGFEKQVFFPSESYSLIPRVSKNQMYWLGVESSHFCMATTTFLTASTLPMIALTSAVSVPALKMISSACFLRGQSGRGAISGLPWRASVAQGKRGRRVRRGFHQLHYGPVDDKPARHSNPGFIEYRTQSGRF